MITRSELKLLSGLKSRTQREETGLLLVEGEHLVREAIQNNLTVRYLLINKSKFYGARQVPPDFQAFRAEYIRDSEFNRLSDTKTPQGISAIVELPQRKTELSRNPSPIILLDNIQDPGNVGTILRTACWFGFKTFILTGGTADVFNPKTLRSSMGASFHADSILLTDAAQTIGELLSKDYQIWGSDMVGEPLYEIRQLPEKLIIVFGSEGEGISPEVRECVSKWVSIPKRGSGESLNVAAAAAIILSNLALL